MKCVRKAESEIELDLEKLRIPFQSVCSPSETNSTEGILGSGHSRLSLEHHKGRHDIRPSPDDLVDKSRLFLPVGVEPSKHRVEADDVGELHRRMIHHNRLWHAADMVEAVHS